jgi:hypothetical protein
MAEVERRRSMSGSLVARRDELTAQLEAINAEIAELESIGAATNGQAHRRGRGRPKGLGGAKRGARAGRGRGGNEKSLPALLHGLLQGKTMSVPEMAEAAKKAGHKSKSKNFRTIVSLAVLNNRQMFKRVSRGQYTAK